MKRKWLLGLGIAVMIGLAFWMRALASWRPQKVVVLANRNDAYSLQISPDGRFLLAGFREIYDLESGKWAPSVPPDESFYGFAPDGTYFSAQQFYSVDNAQFALAPLRAKIFRRATTTGKRGWSALDSPLEPDNRTLCVALSGDQKRVLVRGDSNFRVFDARSGKLLWRRGAPYGESGHFVRDGRFLWAKNGRQHFFQDVATGRNLWRQSPLGWAATSGISPDESLIWIVSGNYRSSAHALFYGVKSGKLLWRRSLDSTQFQSSTPLTISSDSRTVAFMTWTGVEWFEAKSGKRLGSRRGPGRNRASAMALSRDGNWLYTGDKAGQIWKWRLK